MSTAIYLWSGAVLGLVLEGFVPMAPLSSLQVSESISIFDTMNCSPALLDGVPVLLVEVPVAVEEVLLVPMVLAPAEAFS